MSWRSHGDLGVSSELYGVPKEFYLAIACALMALSRRRFHCVVIMGAMRVHGADIALTAFFYSEVVEITGRILLSKLMHEPKVVTMHQPSVFFQPCSNPKQKPRDGAHQ
mgnify:CR=1 FL=1